MHPDIATVPKQTANTDDDLRFFDDSRFAKVVDTPTGEALLIGGQVIHVNGPPRPLSMCRPPSYAELIARALCKIDVGQIGATAGSLQQGSGVS